MRSATTKSDSLQAMARKPRVGFAHEIRCVVLLHDHLSRCKFRCYLVEGIKIAIECQCQSSLCPIHEKKEHKQNYFTTRGRHQVCLFMVNHHVRPAPPHLFSRSLDLDSGWGRWGRGGDDDGAGCGVPILPISNQCWQQ